MSGKKTKISWEDFKNLPWWAWGFIVACAILPIITLGGAIPVAVAFLGIILCVRVSSSPSMTTMIKLLFCVGIVALTWGVTYFFITAMAELLA